MNRSIFVDVVLLVQLVHKVDINKDQGDKYVNGSLLGKPEAEAGVPNPELIEIVSQKNAAYIGNQKPNGEENGDVAEVRPPVPFAI